MTWWVWLIAIATVINIGIIFGCLVRIEKIETKMNQIYKQALKEKSNSDPLPIATADFEELRFNASQRKEIK